MRVPLSETAQDTEGRALNGVSMRVYDRISGLNATVWADASTSTTQANPLTTSNGRVDGWVTPGPVRIEVTDGALPARFTTYDIHRELIPARPPSCRMLKSGATQYMPTNSGATLTWATEVDDTDAMHSTSTQTDRIWINTPGQYLVEAAIAYPAGTVGNRAVMIRHSALGYVGGARANANSVSSEMTSVAASVVARVDASTYFTVEGYASAGATTAIALSDAGAGVPTHVAATWVGR